MKKLVLFVAVVSAASFASCKKDRTCKCDYTSTTTTIQNSPSGSTTVVTSDSGVERDVVYTEAKKGDAKAACLSYTASDSDAGGSAPYTYTSTSETEVTCDLSK